MTGTTLAVAALLVLHGIALGWVAGYRAWGRPRPGPAPGTAAQDETALRADTARHLRALADYDPIDPPRKEQPDVTGQRTPRPMIGVGMPAALHLDAFGREVESAFGHIPYLVGSAAVGKTWRDVDVRLILPDNEFDRLFPPVERGQFPDGMWSLICAAISELARQRTGLPVDFQIQRQSYANDRFPGVRHALGLHDRNGQ